MAELWDTSGGSGFNPDPVDSGSAPSGGGGGGDVLNGVGMLAGAIAGMYTANQQRTMQDHNIQAQKDAAEYEYSKNLEMWNRQNDYNSPAAQMARFNAAGLNPNLIYGQGSSGNASSMPSYHAPTLQRDYINQIPDITGMIGRYQDFSMRQAQIDNLKAQRRYIDAHTASELMKPEAIGASTESTKLKTNVTQSMWPYQAQVLQNKAAQSDVELRKSWQSLANMSRDEQLNLLRQSYLKNQISQQSIEGEQRQANLLFSQMRNAWMKAGVTTADSPVLRMMVRMMNEAGISNFTDMAGTVSKWFGGQ